MSRASDYELDALEAAEAQYGHMSAEELTKLYRECAKKERDLKGKIAELEQELRELETRLTPVDRLLYQRMSKVVGSTASPAHDPAPELRAHPFYPDEVGGS